MEGSSGNVLGAMVLVVVLARGELEVARGDWEVDVGATPSVSAKL